MNSRLLGLSLTAAMILAACGTVQAPKDTTPPEISVVTENNQTIGTSSVTIQGKIKDNVKLKSATYSLNGGAAQPITLAADGGFTVEVMGLVAGENTVVITATDEAGTPRTFAFKVIYNPSLNDKTPPTIVLTTPETQTTTKTLVEVKGKITDDVKLKSATISINGGAAQPITLAADGSFTVQATGLQIGQNSILILAVDEAGNKKEMTVKVVYDANGVGSVAVTGHLASNTSGAPVVNSLVQVDGLPDIQARTDSKGQFMLDLDPGTYNLNFVKEGYAASRVEGLVITSAGAAIELNVVQKVSAHGLVNQPPVFTAVETQQGAELTPVTPGTVFDADKGTPLRVKVKAADPSLSPETIYVGVENTPAAGVFGPRVIFTNDPKNTEFDSKLFTMKGNNFNGIRGDTYLNMVAYDFENNRIQKLIPIKVTSAPNTNPLGAGPEASVLAVTMATKFNFNKAPGQTGTSDELSNLWVQVKWDYNSTLNGDPLGFRVWKSYDNEVFKLYKTVGNNVYSIYDGEPTLEPGKQTYYYIEAFTSEGGSVGKTVSTTPLDVFRITALGPENHSTNVSVKPTLTWTVDKLVGSYRAFYPAIWDYPSQNSDCYWGGALCSGVTDYMYTDDGKTPGLKRNGKDYSLKFNENGKALNDVLQAFHSYTFSLSAAAYNSDKTAISIAQDWSNIFHPQAQCNFGGPVCEGKLSTFSTGDGSF